MDEFLKKALLIDIEEDFLELEKIREEFLVKQKELKDFLEEYSQNTILFSKGNILSIPYTKFTPFNEGLVLDQVLEVYTMLGCVTDSQHRLVKVIIKGKTNIKAKIEVLKEIFTSIFRYNLLHKIRDDVNSFIHHKSRFVDDLLERISLQRKYYEALQKEMRIYYFRPIIILKILFGAFFLGGSGMALYIGLKNVSLVFMLCSLMIIPAGYLFITLYEEKKDLRILLKKHSIELKKREEIVQELNKKVIYMIRACNEEIESYSKNFDGSIENIEKILAVKRSGSGKQYQNYLNINTISMKNIFFPDIKRKSVGRS